MALLTGGAERCDRNGRLAAAGRVDRALLARLLLHPALHAPPPRSLDRDTFGRQFVRDHVLAGRTDPSPPDVLATLTEFVARATARSCVEHLTGATCPVFVSGGGARNPELVRRFRDAFPGDVESAASAGVDPDAKEAWLFAMLAWACLAGVPASFPAVTGARESAVLGTLRRGAPARPGGTLRG